MKRCPYCVEKMQDMAVVCPHCGRDYPQTESEDRLAMLATIKSDSWVRYLSAGVLVMALILSGWVFWFINNRTTQANQLIQQNRIATLQAENVQIRAENNTLSAAAGQPQNTPVPVTDAGQVQQATAQAARISELEAQLTKAQNQSQRYCQGYGQIKFDYTNNETLFAQLKEYAKVLGGEVTKATYTLPWNDPAITLYTINTKLDNKPYTFIFIGYFKSEKMNLQNAIYWIGNDCYLDRQ